MNVIEQANKMFIYFSQLMDKPVFDKNGYIAGEIYDIIVKPSQVYPQSSGLIIRKGFINHKYGVIPWQDILELDKKEARLRIEKSRIIFKEKHNHKEVKYSSTKAPFKLAWYSGFLTKQKATDFEQYLKSSSGFAFKNKRLI